MRRLGCAALALLLLGAPAFAAELRGLDKISGQARTFKANLNTPVTFGSLRIVVRACQQRPPEETPPEAAAYLTITETRGEGANATEPVFQGWMFASSPALNALEHPTYDVWVVSCNN